MGQMGLKVQGRLPRGFWKNNLIMPYPLVPREEEKTTTSSRLPTATEPTERRTNAELITAISKSFDEHKVMVNILSAKSIQLLRKILRDLAQKLKQRFGIEYDIDHHKDMLTRILSNLEALLKMVQARLDGEDEGL